MCLLFLGRNILAGFLLGLLFNPEEEVVTFL
jgi:hypothetical protein